MEPNPVILKAIKSAGGTQAKLAEKAGLSQQYISKLRNNGCLVSADAAIRIARATGGQVRISDLRPEVVEAVVKELGGPSIGETAI